MKPPVQFVDIRRVPLRMRLARRTRAIGRAFLEAMKGLCS